jgi:hypothetical protein
MYAGASVVFGFHGCDESVAKEVIKNNKALRSSEQRYDWLGHGVWRQLSWPVGDNYDGRLGGFSFHF